MEGLPNAAALARRQLAPVTDHIERNFHRAIPVAEMIALAAISHTCFDEAFRLAHDVSPARYLVPRRIAHARAMLASTDEPIIQIAFDGGLGRPAPLATALDERGPHLLRLRRQHP